MKTNVAQQLEDVFQAQGREVLGAFVYWSLGGVQWERAQMRQQWAELGLEAAIGRDPRPEALLGEAIDRAKTGAKGIVWRRLGRYEHALVEEQKTPERLELVHVLTARTSATGAEALTFAVVDPEREPGKLSQEQQAKVTRNFVHLKRFASTSDLSAALVSAMHGTTREPMLSAISMRETSGGLYFVPASEVERMRKLAALVNTETGSNVSVLTLYADEANLATAAAAARGSFTAQLNALRDELREFAEQQKAKGAEFTDRHVETRVSWLQQLQGKVATWEYVLGDVAGELRASIKAAEDNVARELGL